MKHTKKIVWGILLLATGIGILLAKIGGKLGAVGSVPVTDVLLGTVMLAIFICLIIDKRWWALPYPLAAAFLVFEDELSVALNSETADLVPDWMVLGCAALASVGIGLITSAVRKDKKHAARVNFGSDTLYIDCARFTETSYTIKMGDGSVYFEHPEAYRGDGVLNINCKMGNITINVPAAWCVRNEIECNMGNIESPAQTTEGGPLLILRGECKLGNIEIKYC